MCLDEVTNRKPRTTGTGYKIFHVDANGSLIGDLWGKGRKVRVEGEWIKAEDYSGGEHINSGYNYIPYWHIYKVKGVGIARPWPGEVLRTVKYRRAVTGGVQCGLPIIVAKEIYIMPDTKTED